LHASLLTETVRLFLERRLFMLIQDAIEEYLATKRSSITHDTYEWYTYLLDFFQRWCDAHHLTVLAELKTW